MRIHGIRLHNFLRYGETNNIVEFDQGAAAFLGVSGDLVLWERQQLYKKAKEQLKTWQADNSPRIISIVGQTDGNSNESNGSGKSSLFEAVAYAFYEKLIRESVNKKEDRDKGRSTLSIVREDGGKRVTEAFVEVLFSDNDNLYKLKRGRKVNGDKHVAILQLDCLSSTEFADQGSRSGHRAAGDNETIAKLIRMDYETFCNSVMFGQSDAGQFIIGTDKVRKDIIVNILQLGIITDYLQEVRKRKGEHETKQVGLDSQIDVLEAKIKTFDAAAAQSQIVAAQGIVALMGENMQAILRQREACQHSEVLINHQALNTELAHKRQLIAQKENETNLLTITLTQQINRLESRLSGMVSDKANAVQQVNTLRVKVEYQQAKIAKFDQATLDKELALIAQAKSAKPGREAQFADLQEKISALQGKMVAKETLKKAAIERISQFKALEAKGMAGEMITCPNCENHVNVAHIQSKIQENQDQITALQKDIDAFSDDDRALRLKWIEIRDKLTAIEIYLAKEPDLIRRSKDKDAMVQSLAEDILYWEERKQCLTKLESQLVAEQAEKTRLVADHQRIGIESKVALKPIIDELDALQLKASALENSVRSVQKQIADLNAELAVMTQKIQDKNLEIGRLQATIAASQEIAQQVAVLRAERQVVQKQIARLKILEKIFGPDGAQVLIVQKYLPLLNSYLRDYLQTIAGGRMHAAVVTDGKKEGKVDLVVTGESASHSFMLSGGEAVKLRLAMDIALGLLSFARSKDVPEFICLDEVLAPVDVATKTLVFEMLKKLQSHFRHIIIISHDPSLQQHIKNTIVVNKVGGISQIAKQYCGA